MHFLTDNMSAEELYMWIAHRLFLLRSCMTQAKDIGQATSREEQRKELAIVCQRIISMERSRRRNEDDRWLFRPDDRRLFKLALEGLVKATLVVRQVNLFGPVVMECPSELSQEMWRDIGKEFNNNDVLHGEYKDR